MRYLIAGLVTEFEPRYDNLRDLAAPFAYDGERATDITLCVSEESLKKTHEKMAAGTNPGQTENFLMSSAFSRAAIPYGVMLVHSSAIVYEGRAYLFSAQSGVGKSTHTRLWLQEFGDRVHILNDDKPVVRIDGDRVTVCGTPFDGGSGIANKEDVPLGAIVFLERGEENRVRVPDTKEILQQLYFATVHKVNRLSAEAMLENFSALLPLAKFYVLTCNMDREAAHVAFDSIIEQ